MISRQRVFGYPTGLHWKQSDREESPDFEGRHCTCGITNPQSNSGKVRMTVRRQQGALPQSAFRQANSPGTGQRSHVMEP